MNKLKYIIVLACALFYTSNSYAQKQKCVKDMLSQISDVNNSWHPIVGSSVYAFKKENSDMFVVLRLYNSNKTNVDPSDTDIQAVFMRKGNECVLKVIVFGAMDLTKNIYLIAE